MKEEIEILKMVNFWKGERGLLKREILKFEILKREILNFEILKREILKFEILHFEVLKFKIHNFCPMERTTNYWLKLKRIGKEGEA